MNEREDTMGDINYTGITWIDEALAEGEVRTTRWGNTLRETFLMEGDRYIFDFQMSVDHWLQLDSENDASFFGNWVNPTTRRTLSYLEGDLYLVECADDESYDREVASICADNAEAPFMVAIDVDAKTRTEYYSDRREYFIDPDRGMAFIAELEAERAEKDE